MNTLDTVPSDILKYIASLVLHDNVKAISSLSINNHIWVQSQPIIFGPLPITIVKHIIILVIRSNIRAVRSLAINKYIWTLADAIWPWFAKKGMYLLSPLQLPYERLCIELQSPSYRAGDRVFTIDCSPERMPVNITKSLVLSIHAESNRIDVRTRDYRIIFTIENVYYVPCHYYYRYIHHGVTQYAVDAHAQSVRSIELQQQAKHLLTKIHPTLAPGFIF